jgi:hypothetical protein
MAFRHITGGRRHEDASQPTVTWLSSQPLTGGMIRDLWKGWAEKANSRQLRPHQASYCSSVVHQVRSSQKGTVPSLD